MKSLCIFSMLLMPFISLGQLVKGTVKDTSHHPVSGLTVSLKGTRIMTQTDSAGIFEIETSTRNKTLIISGTGYRSVEINVDTQRIIQVTIKTEVNALDEVHVIAYGTSTQRYNVGSITKIGAEDIQKQAITNPLAALQGKVPGLVVTASSGMPGASFKVQIRGQNTLKSNQMQTIPPLDAPLFIVDGVPFAAQNANINQFPSIVSPGISNIYSNAYGGISPFNSISPSDIASIEVLRDADATAIYGSRGGNGVILITTKKGKIGKTDFDMNISHGASIIGKTMPMMNTAQYLLMRREAFSNDQITPGDEAGKPGYAPDLTIFDSTKYTNWKNVFLGGTAHNTNVNASISGGSSNTQFHIGANFSRSTYIYPGDYADDKLGALASIHHTTANKKFTIDLSTNFSYDNNNASGAQDLLTAYTLDPNYPTPVDKDNNLVWYYNGVQLYGQGATTNPFAYLKRKYNIENTLLNSNLQLSYKLFEGLELRSSFGYSSLNSSEYSATPRSSLQPDRQDATKARFGRNDYTTWLIEPQAEYKKNIDKAVIDILIGGTFQKNSNKRTEMDGYNYINDELIGSISGAPTTTAWDQFAEYKYAALFGRVNFRWDNKYLINLNGRRDGSSRFGPNKQFGNFGSVGAGWLFSEERFIREHLPILSYAKLRSSYGITGGDNIGDYNYISRWSPTYYPYLETLGYTPVNLYNPDFSWATTKKMEIGLELGFLKDRFLINASWYRDRSGNQLVSYQLPGITGFANVVTNWDAVVQNSGFELMVNASLLRKTKLHWDASFNITVPKNKLLSFPDIEQSSYATTYIVGQSLSVLNKFRYAGVNPKTGLFQFYDAKGEITSNPQEPSAGNFNDYFNIGNSDPRFFGGFQNTFSMGRLQVGLFLEFKKQLGQNYLLPVYSTPPGFEFNLPVALLDRWQSPGNNAIFQKLSTQYGDVYNADRKFTYSDAVYSDASYIRFKTLSISYSLPSIFLERYKIKNLTINLIAQNLWTITGYKGNDPETQTFYGVPVLRTIQIGLQLNL